MVSEKIKSCEVALGTLMHTVSDEDAAVLRRVRENLRGAAELAQEMEAALVPETAGATRWASGGRVSGEASL